jgi:hypothetical protein
MYGAGDEHPPLFYSFWGDGMNENDLTHESKASRRHMSSFRRKGCISGCLIFPVVCGFVYLAAIVLATVMVERNYAIWMSHKLGDYSLNVGWGIQGRIFDTNQEIVREGRRNLQGTEDDTPTIEELFDRARVCARMGNLLCTVIYDPVYGYPARIEEEDLDMGNVIVITDFRVDTPEPQAEA